MRKIIKVTPKCQMSIHDFPAGMIRDQNHALCNLIGSGCDLLEMVNPQGLRRINEGKNIYKGDQRVIMLVDEEFLMHDNPPEYNIVGSYLYGSLQHGNPILGNILFVAEELDHGEPTFAGMKESLFEKMSVLIEKLINELK